jgi:hypothetical protein
VTGLADSVVARIALQRDLLHGLNDHCEAIRVRATTRNRAVSVEVDAMGALTDLTLGSAATQLSPNELSELIVNIGQTAAKAALARRDQLVAQFRLEFDRLRAGPPQEENGNPT